ncbi:hypothetical protein JVX92_00670 [Microbacterium hominis]|uniref:hypothetical protein n=1 Tax=Microbacterium hominis TaxID=162426 RepID=UPI0019646610|nr:hypothetical protein [Microbacterium hominis]QRY40841.1 hypothetical protein JVX92_00670 [Microbacterium hominis]
MTYPTGVQTVTMTFGHNIQADGTEVPVSLTVVPIFTGTDAVTWAADGTSLLPVTQFYKEGGGANSIRLPVVDQPGWVDGGQNPYTGWVYKITESINGVTKPQRTKFYAPVMGQTFADFDLIPDGSIGHPMVGNAPAVTSVNGQTGAVTIAPNVTLGSDPDGTPVLIFQS